MQLCVFMRVCAYMVCITSRLRAKGSRETVVIMPLKKSDIWNLGAIKQHRIPSSIPPLPPATVTIHTTPPPPSHPQSAQDACECGSDVGRRGTGGDHRKWMGNVLNGNLPPFLTWVSALHQQSKRHSEDGRDEMRTGGGLSFNEEWSTPVDLREHSQLSGMDTPSQQEPRPTARSSRLDFTLYPKQESLTQTSYSPCWAHK